jgi:hypothetical protein
MSKKSTLPEIRPLIVIVRPNQVLTLRRSGRSLWRDLSTKQPIEEQFVAVVIDIERFENVAAAMQHAEDMRPRLSGSSILIGAVGPRGEDLSGAAGRIDGITQRASEDTFEAWFQVIQALAISLKYPNYRDTLNPQETQGAVSREEFEEHMHETARPTRRD